MHLAPCSLHRAPCGVHALPGTPCLAGLVRNGKAAGERMNRHYKARGVHTLTPTPTPTLTLALSLTLTLRHHQARGVRTLPYFEVYDGASVIDRLDASTLSLKSGDSP